MNSFIKHATIFLCILFASGLSAQTIERRVINTTGGLLAPIGGPQLHHNVGETFSSTLSSGGYMLTQGFIQPSVPSVPPITGTLSVCAGSSTTLGNTASGGSWSSSNTSVATIGSTGIVAGLVAGTTTISYTISGSTVTATLTVNAAPIVSAITGNTTLSTAITTTLSNATGGGSWSTATPGVATVNSSGVVTGVAAGTSIISYTVSVSGCSTTVTTMVTVNTPNTTLNFDGTNDFVNIGNILTANQSYTKEAWVYANTSSSSNIISGGSHPFWLAGGRLSTQQGTLINDPALFPLGEWVHVAATYDAASTTLKLYKNGNLIASTTSAGSYPAQTIYIGEYPVALGNAFNGNIDEVRIWNVARTESEIKANMNCNIAQNANLIAYYRFDNGIANGTNTGLTNAIDYSGNNNCGTLTNFNLTGTYSNFVLGAVGNCNTISSTVAAITGASSVCVGSSITLSNATSGGTWLSNNNSIATVSTAGVVNGIAAGTVTISYTFLCNTVTAVVTVNGAPSVATITGDATVCVGSTTIFSNTTSGGSWSSANSSIASVGSSGIVTGNTAGSTTISYTVSNECSSVSTTKSITVNALPYAGTITGPTTVNTGFTITLSNATSGGAWASSNSALATVGSTGVVAGIAAGTVVISYTIPNACGSATTTYNVTVAAVANALNFDGTNDAVILNNDPTLQLTSGTLEAWIKTPNAGSSWRAIVAKPFAFGLFLFDNELVAYDWTLGSGMGNIHTGIYLNDNQWHHVAVTFNEGVGEGSYIYVDGIQVANFTQNIENHSSPFAIGQSGTGEPFQNFAGNIDEVRIWNTPRTQLQIQTDRNCDIAQQANLVGYYRLNEGTANGTNTGITKAIDYSGNNFCGSLTGFALISSTSNYVAGAIGSCSPISTTAPASITGTLNVCVGASTTLGNASSGGVWSANNENISINESTGLIEGVFAGTSVVSYTLFCNTVTAVVTVNPLPIAGTLSGSGSTNMCIGGTNTVSSTGTPGGAWSSTNTAVGTINAATGVLTGIAVGTTSVSYLVTNGCGTDAATRTFTVNPLPDAGTITGASSVNDGASITLTNATTGGTWSSSDPDIATVGSTGVVTGVSAGTVTISYTTTNICGSVSAIKIVTVNAVLESDITGALTVCVGSTTSLSNATSGGSWSSSNNAIATINSDGLVTGVSAGTSVISYTLSGTSVTAIVTVNALPVAGTLGGASSICVGSTATITKTGTGGEWSSSAPATATVGTTGIVSGLTSGTATISYSVTNGCGTVAATRLVTVTALPDAGTISGASSICRTTTTTLTSTVAGGTWSSNYAAGASVNTSTGLVTGLAAGSFIISYRMSSSCGTAYAMFPITVLNAPSLGAISGTATVCASATTTLNNITSGGTWSSTNISAATVDATTGVVTGVAAGTSTISYNVTNICGSATATRVVTVNPLPVAAVITGTATISAGTTTTLTATPAAGTWLSGSGAIASVNTSGVVTGVSAGIATISYNRSNTCGIATATVAVTVSAATTPITGTRVVCQGATTNLANATAGGTWSTADAAIATIGTTGVVTGVAAGTTTVTYAFSGGGTVTAIVTVNAAPAAYTGSGILCIGSQLNLGSIIPGCTWTSGTPSRASVVTATGVVTGVSLGTVNISYVSAGCRTITQLTVNPALALTTGATSPCTGSSITLANATAGGTWSSSNTARATIGETTGVLAAISGGTVTISYTISAGCVRTTTVTVGTPTPIVGNPNVCLGQTSYMSSTGGTWSGSSNPAVASLAANGFVTGVTEGTAVITYRSTSNATCFVTQTMTVHPLPSVIVPVALCPTETATLTSSPAGGTWTSAFPLKASIDPASGLVTAVILNSSAASVVNIIYTLPTTCSRSATVTVNQVPAPIGGGVRNICIAGTATLTSSTSGSTWSSASPSIAAVTAGGVVTGVSAGLTTISYTNAVGCAATAEVTVNAIPGANSGTASLCRTATTTLSNAAGAGTWTSSNSSTASVGMSTGIVTGTNVGTANITYTRAAGCTSVTVVTVNSCARPGMTEGTDGENSVFMVSPNPTTGAINLTTDVAGKVVIYTIDGKQLQQYEAKAGTTNISLPTGIASGVYMLRFNGADGSSKMVRLVYQQ